MLNWLIAEPYAAFYIITILGALGFSGAILWLYIRGQIDKGIQEHENQKTEETLERVVNANNQPDVHGSELAAKFKRLRSK